MREYAQVAPTFWIGETGKMIRKCGHESQLLALYLITSPHANMFGLYYLPMSLITHETGLSAGKVKLCMAKLKVVTFAEYDPGSEFVWVIEMTAYQVGNMKPDDNRLKGLRRAYEALPSNPFIGRFHEKYGATYGLKIRASKGLTEGPEALRYIEQEREQEIDSADAPKRFVPPTPEEVEAYGAEIGFKVNGLKFVNHYAAGGWMRGKTKITNWKACVQTWKKGEAGYENGQAKREVVT